MLESGAVGPVPVRRTRARSGATGIRDHCDLDTATPAGQAFTAAIWLLQAIVWALATLVIAGYTGLIRKIA